VGYSQSQRTLKFTLAYDGTRYAGWQAQRHAGQQPRTIQAILEAALQRILQEKVSVIGSGRTDSGVHALAQVAHCRTRNKKITPQRLLRSLNQLLPQDIAVMRVEEAPNTFHARFDAVRKHYRYRIHTGEAVLPFDRPHVYHVRYPLNVACMRREATVLRGKHDMKALARAGHGRKNTVRKIESVRISRHGQELWIDVIGGGFLHAMVRSIAGTLIDIGRSRLPKGTIQRLLRTRLRKFAGATAPARGLTLIQVDYLGTGYSL